VQPVAAEPGAQGGERAARHTSGASRRRSAHARLKAWVHKSSTSSQSLYRPLTSAGTACGPARLSKGLCAGRLFSFAAVAPPPQLAGSPAPGTPRSAPAAPACHQLLAARCGSPPPVEPVNNSVNKCRRSRSASRASQWRTGGKNALGVSSPAYPAFTPPAPRSTTMALTSSGQRQLHVVARGCLGVAQCSACEDTRRYLRHT